MTAPFGLHAASDVHGGCVQFISFADSSRCSLAQRRERSIHRRERETKSSGPYETKTVKEQSERRIGRVRVHDRGIKIKKGKHRKKQKQKEMIRREPLVRQKSENATGEREAGLSSLQVIAECLADDCGRRGASILHVTRENPISSSVRAR